jgi:hypothetical protein
VGPEGGGKVKINHGDTWMTYSVLLWKLLYPEDPICKGEVIHHIDHNPLNNNPFNLQKMTYAKHKAHHNPGANIREFFFSGLLEYKYGKIGHGKFLLTYRSSPGYLHFTPRKRW